MIILEGPDGGGKTTLVNYLSKRMSLEVAPRAVDKDTNPLVDMVQWVEDNVAGGFQDKIFDRHRLISETIYGPVMRGELERRFDDLTWFQNQLSQFYDLNPIIIYCIPPLPVVIDNVMSSDDNSVFHDNPNLIFRIWSGYVTRYALDSIISDRVYHYDYTQESPELDWKGVLAHMVGTTLYKEGNK